MKTFNVVLLESNLAAMEQLKQALQKHGGYRVIHAGDDGDEGIVKITREHPDLVVTGMFIKGTDGCGVIQTVKKNCNNAKIVACGVANDELIEKALNLGAHYYLVKPFSVSTAMERIEELMEEEVKAEAGEYANAHRKAVTIDEKISEIFISIGIPPHIKGYSYLREAIKMTVETPYVINAVTKELYPGVAKIYNTSSSKVERAIRHAIEVAWNRGRVDAINAIFGTRIYLGTEKPTNSEFIALVADKLILESMM
ncbi:MAG: sporulation transcription factor Spo0A [Clostridiales bacterium]|nr:sporulation transcription factor Spo0A [Clostridiales bacterium]MBO5334578.1 sporulation transcription factor Spo0A [Clostridia bacterium]